MTQPTLKISSVKLSVLVDDPENAREHDEKNLAAIRDSLTQFGQVEPLVVQKRTNMVIGGNGRLTVMRSLGWTHADVVVVDLDDAAARALAIALNRTPELGRWNTDKLNAALAQITQARPDLNVPGFSVDDLRRHMGSESAFLSAFTGGPSSPPVSAPTVDPGSRSTYVDLVLALTPENRSQVYALLNRVKTDKKLANASEALMEVAKHYERTAQ